AGYLFAGRLSRHYSRTNGFCDGLDDKIDLLFRELREHWQGEKFSRGLLRDRERPTPVTQTGIGLLEMNWNRVMYTASYSLSLQLPHHIVSIRHPNGIDMINMTSVLSFEWSNDILDRIKGGSVAGGMRPAQFVSALEMSQLDCKACTLNRIHAAI